MTYCIIPSYAIYSDHYYTTTSKLNLRLRLVFVKSLELGFIHKNSGAVHPCTAPMGNPNNYGFKHTATIPCTSGSSERSLPDFIGCEVSPNKKAGVKVQVSLPVAFAPVHGPHDIITGVCPPVPHNMYIGNLEDILYMVFERFFASLRMTAGMPPVSLT